MDREGGLVVLGVQGSRGRGACCVSKGHHVIQHGWMFSGYKMG